MALKREDKKEDLNNKIAEVLKTRIKDLQAEIDVLEQKIIPSREKKRLKTVRQLKDKYDAKGIKGRLISRAQEEIDEVERYLGITTIRHEIEDLEAEIAGLK